MIKEQSIWIHSRDALRVKVLGVNAIEVVFQYVDSGKFEIKLICDFLKEYNNE
jgi:hypothetical protein